MKVVMYGTKACPDCVEAEEILKEKGIQYLYMEFSDTCCRCSTDQKM